MSYPQPDTGNSMGDLFKRLSDFYQLSDHLLTADTLENFHIWLDKLILIDRRSTVIFLKKHKEELPEDYLKLARQICNYDI